MNNFPKGALDIIISLVPENPEEALAALLPKLRYIQLYPTASPTATQIKCIRTMEPYSNTSFSEIKKHLQAGTIKLGPFHRDLGDGTTGNRLKDAGLQFEERKLTDAEMKTYGPGELPEYFKDKPE